MSCLYCEKCGNLTDTDYDLEGIWSDTGYTCESCAEELETEREDECNALARARGEAV